MSVNSTQNKGLLWQLLGNHPNQKTTPKKFQSVLEYRVNEIHKNRFKFGNDLMLMNKEVIKLFAMENNNAPPAKTKPSAPQLSKTQVFEQNLKAQQTNFDTLINKQKPPDIDFSDKTDEAPIDASVVDNTLQQREQELKNIMAHYDTSGKQTTDWLTTEPTSTNLKIDSESNVAIKSMIIDKSPESKRVRFEETNGAMSFLNKLKKTNEPDDVINYLIRIEAKQDKILALLEKTVIPV
jgi:hypothetical protein